MPITPPPSGAPASAAAGFAAAAQAERKERKEFFRAVRAGDMDAVRETLAAHKGAANWREPFTDADNPFAEDDTPLMAAAQTLHQNVALLLLAHGAADTINTQNRRGYTALMYAAWQNAPEAAQAIMQHGANTNLRNVQDQDAPMLARIRGHDELARAIENFRMKKEEPAAAHKGIGQDIEILRPPGIRKRGK